MKARLFVAMALLVGVVSVVSVVACGKKEEAPAPTVPVAEAPATPVAPAPAETPAPAAATK